MKSNKNKGFLEKGKKRKNYHSPSHFDIRKTQHALLILTVVLCMEKNLQKKEN